MTMQGGDAWRRPHPVGLMISFNLTCPMIEQDAGDAKRPYPSSTPLPPLRIRARFLHSVGKIHQSRISTFVRHNSSCDTYISHTPKYTGPNVKLAKWYSIWFVPVNQYRKEVPV